MRTAIVIPCYNEARRLKPDRFLDAVRGDARINFLFVDDGSTDATRSTLQALCAQAPERMTCMIFDSNQGKAEAVRRGIIAALSAGFELAGYWDADLATPLEEIPRVIGLFGNGRIQVVLCSRVKLLGRRIERRVVRHYLGRVFATVVSLILRLPVYDTQCGAKLFRSTDGLRRVFEEPFTTTWVFDVEILARFIVMEKMALLPEGTVREGVIEYPLEEWHDIQGSKITVMDMLKAPRELWMVHRYLGRNRA